MSHKCQPAFLQGILHRTEDGPISMVIETSLSLLFFKEIECAHAILRREGANLALSHGELVPVSLSPEQGDSPSVLSEESKSRRVFLTCSPSEDLFWAVHSIRFVIDAGVQKRYVCSDFLFILNFIDTSPYYELCVLYCKHFDWWTWHTDILLWQVYNPRIRANSIVIRPISKSQAESRKQLAGPTGEHFVL